MMVVYHAEAVDDKKLARRKGRDSLKAPLDVQLVILCMNYDGCVSHSIEMTKWG